jgi:hypothetical protein
MAQYIITECDDRFLYHDGTEWKDVPTVSDIDDLKADLTLFEIYGNIASDITQARLDALPATTGSFHVGHDYYIGVYKMDETSGNDVVDSIGNYQGTAGAGAVASADGRVFDGTATAKITYGNQVIPLGAKSIRKQIKRDGISKAVEFLADNADGSENNHGTSLSLVKVNSFVENESHWEQGNIDSNNGTDTASSTRLRTKMSNLTDYVLKPNTTYEIKINNSNYDCRPHLYNSNNSFSRALGETWGETFIFTTNATEIYYRLIVRFDSNATIQTSDLAGTNIETISSLLNFSSYKGEAGKRFNLNSTISLTDNVLYDIMAIWDGTTTADKVKMYIKALSGANSGKWHNGTEWVTSIASHATGTAASVEVVDASSNLMLGNSNGINLVLSPNMDTDTNSDGVVDDFTSTPSANHTVAYTLDDNAQKINMTASTDVARSGVYQSIAISPNTVYSLSAQIKLVQTTGSPHARLRFSWRDSGGAFISTDLVDFSTVSGSYTTVEKEDITSPSL